MKNIIVGTAGHIDHGKTALVKALTGIDADRLEEEKRRGITIDLGFAHLQLTPALRLGFVDVPGHERFVKNMLAGVGGIDLVLFVIAADESIKPQTREHFDICRLLGIRRGIIALTKADLVDDDILGLVRLEVEEMVAGLVPGRRADRAGQFGDRRGPGRTARASWRASRRRVGGEECGRLLPPAHRPRLLREGLRHGGHRHADFRLGGARSRRWRSTPPGRRLRVRGVQVHGSTAGRAPRRASAPRSTWPTSSRPNSTRGDVLAEPGRFQAVHADRLPARPAALRQAAEAPRAGAFPFRHGGDRGRGRACSKAPPPMRAGRRRVRAPDPARAGAAAARRPLHHPHVLARW